MKPSKRIPLKYTTLWIQPISLGGKKGNRITYTILVDVPVKLFGKSKYRTRIGVYLVKP